MSNIGGAGLTARVYLSGGAAQFLARATGTTAQVVVFIVGARVLGPEQFGVFAVVAALAMLASIIAQGGWYSFVLSWRGPGSVIRQVLLVALLAGIGMGLAGALAGYFASLLQPDSAVGPLLLLFALWVFLAPNADAQFAVLMHRGRLPALSFCQIAGELAGMAVALLMLSAGYGVLALAGGRIASSGLHLAVCLVLTRTVPARRVSREVLLDLWAFSIHIVGTRLIAYIRSSLATFLVGGAFGAAAVGLFRAAQRLLSAVAEILGEPARQIAWLVMRQAAPEGAPAGSPEVRIGLQRSMEQFMPIILGLTAPVFLAVGLLSEELLLLVLGPEWISAAPIASILAISLFLLMPSVATEPLLALTGHVRYLPRVSLVNAVVTLLFILIALPFGVIAVAWAHVASGVVALATTVWLHQRVGLDWRRIGAECLFLLPILCGVALIILFLRHEANIIGAGLFATLAIVLLPSAAVYLLAVALARAELVFGIWRSLAGGSRAP
jgi:O-antigen/teichoic acid export membrane protein